MKKTRINLAEQYPQYYAATQAKDSFAEVADEDMERLALLESALSQAASLQTEIEAFKSNDNSAALQASLDEKAALINGLEEAKATLETKVQELEAKLAQAPAAAATVVEGSDPAPQAKARVMSSVEKELEKLLGN